MVHVSFYDDNNDEWEHEEFETVKPLGFELALDYLCADNQEHRTGGSPLGPMRIDATNIDYFVMVAAYSGGRQWFEVCIVFSNERLNDCDLDGIVNLNMNTEEDED